VESIAPTKLAPVETKMKVLLNGLPIAYPISGVAQYTLRLGSALEALLGNENVFWFGKDRSGDAQDCFDHNSPTFSNRIQHHLRRGVRGTPGLKALVRIWRNDQFRSCIQRVQPSVYHETNYTPFHFREGPTVVTLYDLSFVRHPEWHPKDRVKHFQKFCLRNLSQADAIITISEFSKKEIMALLGTDPTKIYVTHLGVDPSFTPQGKTMEGLPDEYILFVGNLEPRKNLVTLLNAYRSLPRDLRERYRLVIAGASGWLTKELKRVLHLFRNNEKPILTGYVPQKLLPNLYRGASLFVFPSFYEGFGLPMIEAMASGVPVIASNTTSLPEVIGNAGVLVNPSVVDELKEAMEDLLRNKETRAELSEKGLERAKLFSWEQCARGTLAAYRNVLDEGK
jgi:glycosyltransferase involved in cell wall biosynthesis